MVIEKNINNENVIALKYYAFYRTILYLIFVFKYFMLYLNV